MIRGSECHSLNGRYGLRRNTIPSKRLQDYYVQGVNFSKKKCTRTMTNVTENNSTAQAPLHLPVSTNNNGCGPLILRIKKTGLSRYGFISEFVFPPAQEGFQAPVSGSKPTQPLISGKEQCDVQAGNPGECASVAKEKSDVSKATLDETLEVASILLGLGQQAPLQNTVKQVAFTAQAAPVVQERRLVKHQDHTYCVHPQASAIQGSVDGFETKGRRKKQANPCRIMPREVQTQAPHVQPPGQQSIRSGLDTLPCASSDTKVVGCETKGRRHKQAKPRRTAPSKVQKQDSKILHVTQSASFCSQASFAGLPFSLNQVLGIPQTPCHGFIGGKDLNHGEFSPKDIDIPFEWSQSPREKEDMFFLDLDDSSYKAEAAERKRRETALQSSLRQMKKPLDERYIKNAAVLPDLRQPTPALVSTLKPNPRPSNGPQPQEESLKVHGYNVEDFKRIYHAVVDPKLTTKAGNPRPYGLQMGRVIKQRMWEKFNCPTFLETEGPDGRVRISEAYCSPALKPHAPVINVDISEEPMPEEPERKRSRR